MTAPTIRELGQERFMLDLGFRGSPGLIASFLLPGDDGWTLLETGPTTCKAQLLDGLAAAGVERTEVARVVVTHIHLDHAGGVGALLPELPRATVYVHRLGVPHLIDPTRLEASARQAWGAQMDALFGGLAPVPADRIRPLSGGERWPLRSGDLEVLATPGHARHHLAFVDHALAAVFTGDAAGVRLAASWRTRPAVPPPDLDLDLLYGSLDRMRPAELRQVLRSHFGPDPDGPRSLMEYRSIVEEWRAVAWEAFQESPDPHRIAERLRTYEIGRERAAGHPHHPSDTGVPFLDYELAAQGFLRYFQTRGDGR
ncbi:MAG: MBL fold metallo-hydrolase [Thermoplasmata archaeon]|jgi:glyoxylase-like metal-dependent hydrolase (beta-lactamase superfamily II)